MHAMLICLATATMGIDVGWQRMPEGGMEYIIRLDPAAVESLRAGQPLASDVPPAAGEIRSYRIVVGGEKPRREMPLARSLLQGPELAAPRTAADSQSPPQPLMPDAGTKPLAGRAAVFVEPSGPALADRAATPAAAATAPESPGKPWLPLTLALLGFFASLGANLYLGWLAWDFRRRCAATLQRV